MPRRWWCATPSWWAPPRRLFSKGYVRGFDVKTGQRKWIFHTIPRKGEFGYDTWTTPGQAEASGNTGAWAPMSADTELGLVYVAGRTAADRYAGRQPHRHRACSAKPWWRWTSRPGTRKWHYQMIHHGLWDRDISCAGILCDIPA